MIRIVAVIIFVGTLAIACKSESPAIHFNMEVNRGCWWTEKLYKCTEGCWLNRDLEVQCLPLDEEEK